ncbi:MAG: N-acetylmuramidase domain-containing protein [Candidatus Thorarchaeota archaeon]
MNFLKKIKNIFHINKKKIDNKLNCEFNNKTINKVFQEISCNQNIDINLIKAFYKVESSGRNFNANGKLIIRFERHIFKRRVSNDKIKKVIDSQIGLKHRNQNDEYLSLKAAEFIDNDLAYQSISMGSMQIMGFHYKKLGFNSAKDMFLNFSKNEINVLYGFEKFLIINPPLLRALKNKNFNSIAYYYNGPKYREHVDSKGRNYSDKIKEEYKNLINQGVEYA